MQMNPYLYFDGDCEAAFKFYEKVLGAKIVVLMTHEGTPMAKHVPAEWQTKVLHGRLTIGDQVLMASDAPPGPEARRILSEPGVHRCGRGGTRVSCAGGKRNRDDADRGDILGGAIWYAR